MFSNSVKSVFREPSLLFKDYLLQENSIIQHIWKRCVVTTAAVGAIAFSVSAFLNISLALEAFIVTFVALSLFLVSEGARQLSSLLPENFQKFLRYIKSADKEIFSVVIAAFLYFCDLSNYSTKGSGTPILLVHGYLHNSSGWLYLLNKLNNAGYGPIYTINLGPTFYSIEDFSRKVEEMAEKIERETDKKNLILIGHSMGGIVSSYYALNDDLKDKVEKVITLSSPIEGTKMACFGFGECVKQMSYQSIFSNDLIEKIKNCHKINFTMIGSEADLIVIPQTSSIPRLDRSNVTVISLKNLGHLSPLFSHEVANAILQRLSVDSCK